MSAKKKNPGSEKEPPEILPPDQPDRRPGVVPPEEPPIETPRKPEISPVREPPQTSPRQPEITPGDGDDEK